MTTRRVRGARRSALAGAAAALLAAWPAAPAAAKDPEPAPAAKPRPDLEWGVRVLLTRAQLEALATAAQVDGRRPLALYEARHGTVRRFLLLGPLGAGVVFLFSERVGEGDFAQLVRAFPVKQIAD